MTESTGQPLPRVAIACGGTGGHLFPGLAVAEELQKASCEVTIITSEKEIDRQASAQAGGAAILRLPAVGLSRGAWISFARAFLSSCRASRQYFKTWRPDGLLAMGGFTSAPSALVARANGAAIFLHESNAVPGRANRWLSWVSEQAFIGFASAREGLRAPETVVTGTPVRSCFQSQSSQDARAALAMDPARPVLLVMGGSQGARPLNQLILAALPKLVEGCPELQFLHLAGPADTELLRQVYANHQCAAVVHSFFERMDVALAAATIALSRAGASSLAELAAMRLPALLVPYPAATDNHQLKNALAYSESGAGLLLEQGAALPEKLASEIAFLLAKPEVRRRMQEALALWHSPGAALQIAQRILETIAARRAAGQTRRGLTSPPLKRHPMAIA